MTTAAIIRLLLFIDVLGMAFLAIFYLRRRRLSWLAYLCWSLLALFLPIAGPFLVISLRPGGKQAG